MSGHLSAPVCDQCGGLAVVMNICPYMSTHCHVFRQVRDSNVVSWILQETRRGP